MGAFLVNFHVRTRAIKKVSLALKVASVADAWIARPKGKWVSFWERTASEQDINYIRKLLSQVSDLAEAPAIAFLVHDSEALRFWLFDCGQQVFSYDSSLNYWGETVGDLEPPGEKFIGLLKWCRAGTDFATLQSILAQPTFAEGPDAGKVSLGFAEMQLQKLSPILGIAEDRLLSDFNDFETDIRPEDFDATRITQNQEPSPDVEENYASAWSRKSPLFAAINCGDIVAIEQLVTDGIDLNEIPDGVHSTALAFAVANSTIDVVRKLVELGADPNGRACDLISPLRQAVDCEKGDCIRVLAELGANVNEYDPELGSLLHIAVFHQGFSIIPALIEIKVDPQLTNPGGLTAQELVAASAATIQHTISQLEKLRSPLPINSMTVFSETLTKLERAHQILSKSNWIDRNRRN